MASTYAKQQTQQQQQGSILNNQMSVLAQAKPAIVSPSTNSFNISTGALSEKINSALNLSSAALSHQERTDISKLFSNYDNKQNQMRSHHSRSSSHIEDDGLLMKQNASNQMRQAAVMAAVASQQKVRLSATERLALTAKRPMSGHLQPLPRQGIDCNASSAPQITPKPAASLPTLETLLAVQRQLQQHTRQNLNSVPQQQMVNKQQQQQLEEATNKPQPIKAAPQDSSSPLATRIITPEPTSYQPHAQCKKPLPPSPPKTPSLNGDQQCSIITTTTTTAATYEKELPPLPQSVSPSTTTDDSQLNSLDSQSSPATSLVSIPPPPPPISSYLEQYDEVNSACRQSNSSTPSTIATSDISSVKQFSFAQSVPNKQQCNQTQNANVHPNQQQPDEAAVQFRQPPTLAPKPQFNNYQRVLQDQINRFNRTEQMSDWSNYKPILMQQVPMKNGLQSPQEFTSQSASKTPVVVTDSDSAESSSNVSYDISYKPQIDNYQQHVFTRTSASLPMMPPPPPLPPSSFPRFNSSTNNSSSLNSSSNNNNNSNGGFDVVDSADFRFPTPPPLDMLLDEVENGDDDDDDVKKPSIHSAEDYDEDFQCRIPTPPPHKSMSTASFQDLRNNNQAQQKQQQLQQVHRQQSLSPPSFNSSAFSANFVQPPALFRQSSDQHLPLPPPPPLPPVQTAPQLTVHINNNEGGLLSTATNANNLHPHLQAAVNHHHHHHHHHMMLTMEASSSSPSSSSDGDGQSSNSSSSTSGIHSSIDSPSSSNSKLDDFNYSAGKHLKGKDGAVTQSSSSSLKNHNQTANNNHLKNISSKLTGTTVLGQHVAPGVTGPVATALASPPPPPPPQNTTSAAMAATTTTTKTTTTTQTTTTATAASKAAPVTIIKPALKQKKTVSFSDKVELVACAEEQCEEHLPNPLLARVLAGKLQ